MWQEKDNKFQKRFKFEDFTQSLEFVNKVGLLAEEANHHPDICFGWGYVEITLITHSTGEVTDKDHELAARIDEL